MGDVVATEATVGLAAVEPVFTAMGMGIVTNKLVHSLTGEQEEKVAETTQKQSVASEVAEAETMMVAAVVVVIPEEAETITAVVVAHSTALT